MKSFAKPVAAVLLLAAIPAHAQVFKCVVDGKTVYQQAPCAGESKAVNLPNAAPPSAADIEAAKKRNELDKLLASAQQDLSKAHDSDCAEAASLAKIYGIHIGRCGYSGIR